MSRSIKLCCAFLHKYASFIIGFASTFNLFGAKLPEIRKVDTSVKSSIYKAWAGVGHSFKGTM